MAADLEAKGKGEDERGRVTAKKPSLPRSLVLWHVPLQHDRTDTKSKLYKFPFIRDNPQ
jgi:hypothetical protein